MKPDLALRLTLTLAGALAGFALWYLVIEQLEPALRNKDRAAGLLMLTAFAAIFFGVFLIAAGPLRTPFALLAGLITALPLSLAFLLGSFRFETTEDYLFAAYPIFCLILSGIIATPFAISALVRKGGWLDYTELFAQSWTIITRLSAGALFTALVWLVIMLSLQLMMMVDVPLLAQILSLNGLPMVITGAAFGLGLALVHEMSDRVSPEMTLRLLQILLPPFLLISLIFIALLPLRGFSQISQALGGFSSALVLIMMTLGALSLVTVVIERSDAQAVASRWMQGAARLLALCAPLLAAGALTCVILRVQDYGLTPARIFALAAVLVLQAYGLAYGVSVIRAKGWMERIRRANIVLALISLGVAILFLTPVLNPERIATRAQISAYTSGRITLDQLDLYPMAHAWGLPGQRGLAELAALERPDKDELAKRIETAKVDLTVFDEGAIAVVGKYPTPLSEADAKALLAFVPVRPEGAVLPFDLNAAPDVMEQLNLGCHATLEDGRAACVLVVGDFMSEIPGDEVWALAKISQNNATAEMISGTPGKLSVDGFDYLDAAVIARVLDGDFTIDVPAIRVLRSGSETLWPPRDD